MRDRPPLVRSGETISCGGLYCPFLYGSLREPSLCYRPPYTTVVADAARFFYGWCATLYCPTPSYTTVRADAARFYTVGCAIVHCATPPPLHYCWGGYCPFFIRLVRNPLLSYPLYTTVGADAARFFIIYGWLRESLLRYPPLHYCGGRLFLYTAGSANLYCATPPYTTVGADAARFRYGRRVGRPFTVLPPYNYT